MTEAPVISPHLQAFAGAVLVGFLGWVVYLVRYHRLSLRDSLVWLLSTAAALFVTILPGPLVALSRALGVAVPANALFALAFVYVLLNLLALTVTISTQATRVRRLTQECALLRAHVEELRRSLDAERGGG